MGVVRRIQHVSVTAPLDGAERARQFYGGVLGFREKPVPETLAGLDILAWFEVGPDELHVVGQDEPGRDSSRRHVCFEVEDLQAVRAALEQAGYAPYDAAPIPGRPRFFCRDPFGNLLEFMVFA